METQSILQNANLTKTEKIRRLPALGLSRREVANLTGGNYGFVQNVFARYWPEQVQSRSGVTRHRQAVAALTDSFRFIPFTRKFGVEIEAFNVDRTELARALRQAGVNVEAEGYNHNTRNYWKIVTDASLSGSQTFELVSPILQGQAGLDELQTVCQVLKAKRAFINRSCGLHVHFDAEHIELAQTKNLLLNYARYESIIDSFMPSSRRGTGNTYCQSLTPLAARIDAAQSMQALTGSVMTSRYFKVNLQSYLRYKTIEFRQHSGTVEFEKISNWVLFLHNLVEYSRFTRVQTASLEGLQTFQQPELFTYLHNRQSELAA